MDLHVLAPNGGVILQKKRIGFVKGCVAPNKGKLRTHCGRGHPFIETNIRIQKRPDGIIFRACKLCQRAGKKAALKRGNLREATVRRVMEALDQGRTLSTITKPKAARAQGLKIVIMAARLIPFRRKHPKFDRLLLKRSAENAERNREQSLSLLRISAPAIVIARSLDIWEIIRSSVPESWPTEKREETISRLGLAVSEGRVNATPQAIAAAVQKAASAHNKMFSEWAVGGGAGKWVSLERRSTRMAQPRSAIPYQRASGGDEQLRTRESLPSHRGLAIVANQVLGPPRWSPVVSLIRSRPDLSA
jgi:hypothetical protein